MKARASASAGMDLAPGVPHLHIGMEQLREDGLALAARAEVALEALAEQVTSVWLRDTLHVVPLLAIEEVLRRGSTQLLVSS